jgi:small subunit ribosomal protein S8
MAKHSLVEIPSTKMTRNITAILKEEGFIEDSKEVTSGINKSIVISLKYLGKNRKPVITTLKRVSKPGVRTYAGSKNIPSVLGNLGIAILSTSKGVITDTQARQLKVGGEVLCYIW